MLPRFHQLLRRRGGEEEVQEARQEIVVSTVPWSGVTDQGTVDSTNRWNTRSN